MGWGWSVVVGAGRFEVGRLGLVGRGLRVWVWGWWVGVGQCLYLRVGALRCGVGAMWASSSSSSTSYGCVRVGLRWVSWGSWVAVDACVRAGMAWVGRGRSQVVRAWRLVGWGWSGLVCA